MYRLPLPAEAPRAPNTHPFALIPRTRWNGRLVPSSRGLVHILQEGATENDVTSVPGEAQSNGALSAGISEDEDDEDDGYMTPKSGSGSTAWASDAGLHRSVRRSVRRLQRDDWGSGTPDVTIPSSVLEICLEEGNEGSRALGVGSGLSWTFAKPRAKPIWTMKMGDGRHMVVHPSGRSVSSAKLQTLDPKPGTGIGVVWEWTDGSRTVMQENREAVKLVRTGDGLGGDVGRVLVGTVKSVTLGSVRDD